MDITNIGLAAVTPSPNVAKVMSDVTEALRHHSGQMMTSEMLAGLMMVMMGMVKELPSEQMVYMTSMSFAKLLFLTFKAAECSCDMIPLTPGTAKES